MIEKIFQKNENIIQYSYTLIKFFLIFICCRLAFNLRVPADQSSQYVIIPVYIIILSMILKVTFFKDENFYNKSYKLLIKEDIYIFLLSLLLLIFVTVLLKTTYLYSRVWLILFISFTIVGFSINKFIFNKIYESLINSNKFRKNILLIGNYDECKELLKGFGNDNRFHFRACIFIDNSKIAKLFPIQQINLDDNLRHNIIYYSISQIWVIASENLPKSKIINQLNTIPIDIRTIYKSDSNIDHYIEKINGYNIYDTSLSPFFGINYISKLFIDYFLGSILFLISLPIIILFGLLIYFEDGSPIFFIQKRHGWDGNIIKILKLRSLKKSKHKDQVKENDVRVLKIGKFIRRFSIDELPQFINVLKGDMSIVGPRPHAIEHNDEFSYKIKGFMQRHRCKPGLTGLAQMKGFRGNIDTKEKLVKRYEYDIEYIKRWSVFLDLYLIIQTIFKFLFQKAH